MFTLTRTLALGHRVAVAVAVAISIARIQNHNLLNKLLKQSPNATALYIDQHSQ